ncbi:MAG: hypothetical protein LBM28_06285 [Oscillospiraceae bacterium]|jgi:hypothetical protein|nr:hypothetical protein [Oscillospiraceae bacterium]
MNTMIERYVFEVTRRLPEKEREDVKRELTANIMDMLSDNPNDEEIEGVLNELGDPSKLSEKYRQNPRYLISPAVFETYLRTIKIVLPIAGCVCFILGFILGITEFITDAPSAVDVFKEALKGGFSLGIDAVIQALLWTTIGFVIADHATGQTEEKSKAWTVDKLPKERPDDKARISLSDGVVSLCMTAVFSTFAVIMCVWRAPFGNLIFLHGKPLTAILSDSFLNACIPVIIIAAVFGIIEAILKIVRRRWSISVCAAAVAGHLAWFAGVIYLITRPNILSDEFVSFAASHADEWGRLDIIRLIGSSDTNSILLVIGGLAAVGAAFGCISAVFKTVKVLRKN